MSQIKRETEFPKVIDIDEEDNTALVEYKGRHTIVEDLGEGNENN